MSRHLLIDRPTLRIVLGFDPMLQSVFGQRFRPGGAEREGMAVDGWPTRSGLGTRRPIANHADARQDLEGLRAWARRQQPEAVWAETRASRHLDDLIRLLHREWAQGEDLPERAPSAVLMGSRP